ncbi:DUF2586 family protein [Deinococcus radiotolerans]|uniref:Tail sheath protein subtilisin-like domain-containing protein n=1 Tax=Deinococcus radiotolerans TaxID=1309407 RepID=A0ABQ2FQ76_9DEIO|nr:DUF2586 family protein [Deinococcus radiotolerans]GGL15886.1 hypothetical protein GCM10010844_38480 [Deinococcus radiotolerans]
MTLPGVKVKFQDYQLGLVPAVADAHAKVGVAQAGPLTPQRFTRGTQVADTYQGGPLAGAIAVALIETSPVIGVRVPTTTPGAPSAVTKVGTGLAVMTVGGTPNDVHSVLVTVTRPGTRAGGDAAVILTVDGAAGSERSVPSTGLLAIAGTGLTVTFDAAALVAGDTYAFTTTAPAATVADIAAALESLLSTRPDLRFVHVLGNATPALVAAVDAILVERETRNYYTHALLEARPRAAGESMSDYLAAIDAQFDAVTSVRVAIALDGGGVYNPLTRQVETRNAAWKLTARRATVEIGESPYRIRSGALPAMDGTLAFDANLVGTTGRFASLRTHDGRDGIYASDWPLLAPEGSDYGAVQRREVADRAAQLGFIAAMDFLGEDLPVDTTTGRVLETTAAAFDTFVEGRIRAGIGGNASGIRVRFDREVNILSTEAIAFDLSVIPLGYAKYITVRVGFLNPMLAAQTAAAPAAPTDGGS